MKKNKMLIFALIFFATCTVFAADEKFEYGHIRRQEIRIYDSSSRYKGKIDSQGRIYDSSHRCKGRIDNDGRIYDSSSRFKGYLDYTDILEPERKSNVP